MSNQIRFGKAGIAARPLSARIIPGRAPTSEAGKPWLSQLPPGPFKAFTPQQWEQVFKVLDKFPDIRGCLSGVAAALSYDHRNLKRRYEARNTSDSKPGPDPRLGPYEDELREWLDKCDGVHANPTKAMLQEKAKELAAWVRQCCWGFEQDTHHSRGQTIPDQAYHWMA